jgi:hypothetical protein
MPRSALTLFFLMSAISIGCSEDPQIAGNVVFFVGIDLSEQLVMSTGNDGQEWVTSDDRWSVDCSSYDSPFMKLTDKIAYDNPTKRPSFGWFSMLAQNDTAKLDETGNVTVVEGYYYYSGICDVHLTEISKDPYEAEFSTSDCDLLSKGQTVGHVETAKFRVKSCDDEAP